MEHIPSRQEITQLLNEPSTYAHYSRDDLFHVVKNTLYNPFDSRHQYLTVVGTHHITDPRHWYYADDRIPEVFCDWVEKTTYYTDLDQIDPTNRVIIAEGLLDAYDYVARYDRVTDRIYPDFALSTQNHWSEIGLLCAASDTLNIPLVSGEPEHFSEFASLIQTYPDHVQEIIDYYILRDGPLFNRIGEHDSTLEDFMNSRINMFKRHLGKIALRYALPPLFIDYESFKKRFYGYFGRSFNPEDEDGNSFLLRVTSAELEDESFANQPVARIAPEVMRLRDIHLARLIFRYLAAEKSVFYWGGLHHTLALSRCFTLFGNADIESYELGLGYLPLNQHDKREGYIFKRRPMHYKGRLLNTHNSTQTDETETKLWQSFSRPPTPHPYDLLVSSDPVSLYYKLEELSEQPIQVNTYIGSLTNLGRQWHKNFTGLAEMLEDKGLAYTYAMPALRRDIEANVGQVLALYYPTWHIDTTRSFQNDSEDSLSVYYDTLSRTFTRFLSILHPPLEEVNTVIVRLAELLGLYIKQTQASKGELSDAIAAFDVTSLHFAGLYTVDHKVNTERISRDFPAHIVFEYLLATMNSLVEGRDYIHNEPTSA